MIWRFSCSSRNCFSILSNLEELSFDLFEDSDEVESLIVSSSACWDGEELGDSNLFDPLSSTNCNFVCVKWDEWKMLKPVPWPTGYWVSTSIFRQTIVMKVVRIGATVHHSELFWKLCASNTLHRPLHHSSFENPNNNLSCQKTDKKDTNSQTKGYSHTLGLSSLWSMWNLDKLV